MLVKYPTNKNARYFVGLVTAENKSSFMVKFLRRYEKTAKYFVWPKEEDIDEIQEKYIERVLPPPTVNRYERYAFNIDFSTYNVE